MPCHSSGMNRTSQLAGELGAIIQYLTYAAQATEPYWPQPLLSREPGGGAEGLRLLHLLRREAPGDVLRAVPVERLDDDRT